MAKTRPEWRFTPAVTYLFSQNCYRLLRFISSARKQLNVSCICRLSDEDEFTRYNLKNIIPVKTFQYKLNSQKQLIIKLTSNYNIHRLSQFIK